MCSTRLELALPASPPASGTATLKAPNLVQTRASQCADRPIQRLALRRHQLVGLSQAAWQQVLALTWRDEQRGCVQHWSDHGLPLILSRQDLARPELPPAEGSPRRNDMLALGLPAPGRWGRHRLSLQVPLSAVQYFDELPGAAEVVHLLAATLRGAWLGLCRDLAWLGLQPQVFGSFGWQQLTGLSYLRPASDIDLLLPVDSPALADAVVDVLTASGFAQPRLDGELVFADGSAVAWREWQVWRARQARPESSGRHSAEASQILVKRLDSVTLETGTAWLDRALLDPATPCSR